MLFLLLLICSLLPLPLLLSIFWRGDVFSFQLLVLALFNFVFLGKTLFIFLYHFYSALSRVGNTNLESNDPSLMRKFVVVSGRIELICACFSCTNICTFLSWKQLLSVSLRGCSPSTSLMVIAYISNLYLHFFILLCVQIDTVSFNGFLSSFPFLGIALHSVLNPTMQSELEKLLYFTTLATHEQKVSEILA